MGDQLVRASSGLERINQTLSGYRTVVDNVARGSAFAVMEKLHEFTRGERVVAFVQALRRDHVKAKVVLVLTSERLIAIDEQSWGCEELWIEEVELLGWQTDFWHGSKLTLRTPYGDRVYKQLMPDKEGLRIAEACGLETPSELRSALPKDMPDDPGVPPVAAFWRIHVYEDRLIDHENRHLPFNGDVEAVCDHAGNIAVTRGRNLAAKGLGTLAFGPIGLFFMGNAKHREIDTRELYLLVEGPNWAYTAPFKPDAGAGLRQFAGEINVIAKQHLQRVKPQPPAAGAPDADADGGELMARLRGLAKLKDEGILTDEEFAAAKGKLLADL